MKTCSCGKRYTAAEWAALPPVGSMYSETEEGRWIRLELKNCVCRSTMALEFFAPPEFRGTEDECRMLLIEQGVYGPKSTPGLRFEAVIKDQADPVIVLAVKQIRRLRIAIDEFLEDYADGK